MSIKTKKNQIMKRHLQTFFSSNEFKIKGDQKKSFLNLSILKHLFLLMLFFPFHSFSQALTGTKTIPGNYTSIASAIADLNTNGVGTGGVIFNINAGYVEFIPTTLSVTATGTAANPIIFRRNPVGTGVNPVVVSYTGTMLASSSTFVDGIWQFIGSDFITIDGIDLLDPLGNNNPVAAMEYGFGFYKTTGVDGSNNNIVKNCTITLHTENTEAATGPRWAGSIGIELAACNPAIVGNIIVPISVAGASSNNKFYNNTIRNCNGGIALSGAAAAAPYTLADQNNDIGGTSVSSGNKIINFGGDVAATSACMAIWTNNQWNLNISYNTVTNNDGTGTNHPLSNRGIFVTGSAGASATINNNIVTIEGGSSTTSIDWGIDCEMAQTGANGNTISIDSNIVTMTKMAPSTVAFTGIWINSAATTVNVNNNIFPSFTYGGRGTAQCILSQLGGIGILNIKHNSMNAVSLGGPTGSFNNIAVTAGVTTALNIIGDTINGVTLTGATTKTYRGILVSEARSTCAINLNENNFSAIHWSGGGIPTGEFALIHGSGTAASYTINKNVLTDTLTIPTEGAVYLIYNAPGTPIVNIKNNNLTGTGVFKTGSGAMGLYGYYNFGIGSGAVAVDGNVWNGLYANASSGMVCGIYLATEDNIQLIRNNTISNISSIGIGRTAGIYFEDGMDGNEISGNIISNISGGSATSGILLGEWAYNPLKIVNNQISFISTSGVTLAAGISYDKLSMDIPDFNLSIYNNKIYGISGSTAGSSAHGISTIGATPLWVYNNLIDSINTPSAGGVNAVIGISITNSVQAAYAYLYYNTILISGTSTATNFGSSGIYAHTPTCIIAMSNNSIINNSIPKGTGLAVAYRRGAQLAVYSHVSSSNNNLFYAGLPAANRCIYYDGTYRDTILSSFQARVSPAENVSVTENTTFINTVGSLPNFLQPDSIIATRIESGGVNIPSITVDITGATRYGNPGYNGTGSAPDIGAYERTLTGVPMVFDSAFANQITNVALKGTTNQSVLRLKVVLSGTSPAASATGFKFNTAGTTNVTDISNAKVFYTGTSATFNTAVQFGNPVATPNGTFYVTGNQRLSRGINYFWLTYDIPTSANTANRIDTRFDSITIDGVLQASVDGDPFGTTPLGQPLAGVYTIGALPYLNLAAVITDLNQKGISSNVIIKIPAGYTEIAPAGGFQLGSTLLNGTLTASQRLIFIRDGLGKNPILYSGNGRGNTAGSGFNIAGVDGIFILSGCDYVTINGIDLMDVSSIMPSETPTPYDAMEIGYGFNKLNTTAPYDGCQFDTIMNSTITLKRTTGLSRGISVNNTAYNDPALVSLPISAVSDAHSYNVFMNDSIQNVANAGIWINGYNAVANTSLYDQNNVVHGNVVVDYLGSTSVGGFSPGGIVMANQTNNIITGNTIDNYNGGIRGAIASTGNIGGILNTFHINTAAGSSALNPSNVTVTNNFVRITQGSSSLTTGISAITVGYSYGNTTINNNNLKFVTTVANGGGTYTGISFTLGGNNIPGTTQNFKNNHLDSVTFNSNAQMRAFYITGGIPNGDFSGNSFTVFNRTGTSGNTIGFNLSDNVYATVPGTIINMYNNIIDSINNGNSTGSVNGYWVGGAYNFNFHNNTINRVTAMNAPYLFAIRPTTGTIDSIYNNTITNIKGAKTIGLNGIYLSTEGINLSTVTGFQRAYLFNNIIANLTCNGGPIWGINAQYTGRESLFLFKNTIHAVSAPIGTTSTASGIYVKGAPNDADVNMPIHIYNNRISKLEATLSTVKPAIAGIRFDYNTVKYTGYASYNTIYLPEVSVGAGGSSAGIYIESLIPAIKLSNNIVINNSIVSGSGIASAIQRNGTNLNTYDLESNNNLLFAGAPSPSRVLYNDGTNQDQTLIAFKGRVTPRDVSSITEDVVFISASTPTSPFHLQPDSLIATGIESSALAVTGIIADLNGRIRHGNPDYTGTGTAPDIGAIEGNYTVNDIAAPAISFTKPGNTISTGDRVITAIITDYTGVPVSLVQPRLYYKKSVAGTYTVANGTLISGNVKNGTWSFLISASGLGGILVGDSVYYYIVAQDTSAANNLGSLPLGVNGTNVLTITQDPPTVFNYKILSTKSGIITVGISGTYTSLTNSGGAFDAINNSALSGNVVLKITSDLQESGNIVLNKWNEIGTGNYTLRIEPDNAAERLIIDAAATNNPGLITFDGATRVTVDGRFNGSGQFLRFRNRVTSGAVFTFRNDAVNNTIMNTYIESVNNTSASILFGTSTVVGGRGNDSNNVIYNTISDISGLGAPTTIPNAGISSSGTIGLENDANRIAYNTIYNWGYNAVNLTNTGTGNYWTIYANKIYQTANRTTGPLNAINLQGGAGHIIRKNSIGGAATDRSGISMKTDTTVAGIYQTFNSSVANTIDSNLISNMSGEIAYGIYIKNGAANIYHNIIGGMQNLWDSITSTSGNNYGIYTAGNQPVVINGNDISNLRYNVKGTATISGIYLGPTGLSVFQPPLPGTNNIITNNIVHDIIGNSGNRNIAMSSHSGIAVFDNISGGYISISNNNVYNIINTGIGSVSGMLLYSPSSPVTVSKNKVHSISGFSGTVNGIYAAFNTSSGSITNNQISLQASNLGQVNAICEQPQTIYSTNKYYNNSVFINGVATDIYGSNSYVFFRAGTLLNTIDVRNNIFYNKHIGGTGKHYAIGSVTANGISPSSFSYNLMVIADTAAFAESPYAMRLSEFNAVYKNSPNTNWTETVSNLPAQTLFTDTATSDLSIATSHSNNWYANGKGIAITSVSSDFSGNPRSTTIAGGATDIGAFEFSTATIPPLATASAAPALNGTTNYMFAGKKIASITWGATGTVPVAVDVKYYTGTDAPSLLSGRTHINSYYAITPTGGSGYTYDIALNYDSAMMGSVSSAADLKMAFYRSSTSNWYIHSTSSANRISGLLSSGTYAASNTLAANFTGTDNLNNPLPVELFTFNATKIKNDVLLNWTTLSENNSELFEVERSFDGKNFERFSSVSASGYSTRQLSYKLNDGNIIQQTTSDHLFYRLKIINSDGSFDYSKVVVVNVIKETMKPEIVVFPNPAIGDITASFVATSAGNAQCTIYDIMGRNLLTYSQEVKEGDNQIHMNMSSLNPGLYFLSVEMNGEKHTSRIIKQ
jgi:hypothetical protein